MSNETENHELCKICNGNLMVWDEKQQDIDDCSNPECIETIKELGRKAEKHAAECAKKGIEPFLNCPLGQRALFIQRHQEN